MKPVTDVVLAPLLAVQVDGRATDRGLLQLLRVLHQSSWLNLDGLSASRAWRFASGHAQKIILLSLLP